MSELMIILCFFIALTKNLIIFQKNNLVRIKKLQVLLFIIYIVFAKILIVFQYLYLLPYLFPFSSQNHVEMIFSASFSTWQVIVKFIGFRTLLTYM